MVGFSYLGMFFLMGAVNVLLICVMRQKKKAALLRNADATEYFREESCILKIILFFFELSYLNRFLWD